jgi:restriction system protein
MAVPKYDDLFSPLLSALQNLGGSSSISEMEDEVAKILQLSDNDINEVHDGNRTKLSYRLAWARNYLKRFGLVENSSRGVWSLTPKGYETKSIDKNDVKKFVNKDIKIDKDLEHTTAKAGIAQPQIVWQDELLNILKKLEPSEFERLCQRVLRESGFIQVTVTGKSGDGGIDGTGIVRLGGFLSFRVIFQCKRYQGSVSSQQIREFKGTMVGRADKGLFITTGTFTRDAKTEATRDGSPPIDLVDGEQLVEKMKELGLGVKIKTEELVEVNDEWLKSF